MPERPAARGRSLGLVVVGAALAALAGWALLRGPPDADGPAGEGARATDAGGGVEGAVPADADAILAARTPGRGTGAAARDGIAPGRASVLGTLSFPGGDAPGPSAATLRIERGSEPPVERRVEAGPFEVEYAREGGAFLAWIVAPGFRARSFPLPSARTDLGRVALVAAARYGGRVLDPDGRPVAGARVHLFLQDARRAGEPSETDADGAYRIDLDGPPESWQTRTGWQPGYTLRVAHRGIWSEYRARVEGWTLSHDLSFHPDQRPVRLRFVRTPGGAGLPGLTVRMLGVDSWRSRAPPAVFASESRTDGRGEVDFPFRGLAAPLLLHVSGTGEPFFYWLDPAYLSPPAHEIDVRPDDVAVFSTRVVRAADGSPVAGVRVWATGAWVEEPSQVGLAFHLPGTSGADGRIAWRFLPRASGRGSLGGWIAERDEAGATVVERGAFAKGDATIVLGDPERTQPFLWVRAIDASTGTPAVLRDGWLRVEVPVEARGDERPFDLDFLAFDARPAESTGAFGALAEGLAARVDGQEDGARVDLWLRASGRPMRRVDTTLRALRTALRDATPLVVRLPTPSPEVRVRVQDAAGAAVGGALVTLLPDVAPHGGLLFARRAVSDDSGTAEFTELESGLPYFVSALEERSRRVGVHGPWLPRGETTVRLSEGRPLSFRVLVPGGRAAPHLRVTIVSRPEGLLPTHGASGTPDGRVRIAWIQPEAYELRIGAHGPDGTVVDGRPRWRGWGKTLPASEIRDGQDLVLDPQ